MAVDETLAAVGIAQIVAQFAAAYLSYTIYKYNRLNKAWLAVTVALVLMGLHRFVALAVDLQLSTRLSGPLHFLDQVVGPFAISVFLLWGLWSMKASFETLDFTEKKTKEKIERLVSKKKASK